MPGISLFFLPLQKLNKPFYKHKDRDDNRWSNGPIFHNTSFIKNIIFEKVLKKVNQK